MTSLLTRLRNNKKRKASRQLTGHKVPLTASDAIALARPHPLESRTPTPLGILRRDECYMFRDRVLGDMIFNIRAIKDAILAGTLRTWAVYEIPLTEGFHEHLMKDGVETSEDHIYNLPTAQLNVPALGVDWNDGSQGMTVIDGNHRLIRRFRDGLPTGRIILTPMQFLRRYVLLDRLGELSEESRAEFARMPPPR